VTTRAIKGRLHDLAREFDRLADAADGAVKQPGTLGGLSEAMMKRPAKRSLSNIGVSADTGCFFQSFKNNHTAGNGTDGTPIGAFPGAGGTPLQ